MAGVARSLAGFRGVWALALMGLLACGEDSGAGVTNGAEVTEAAREAAAANELAQADIFGLERRVEVELELDPADWEALRQEGRSLLDTFIDTSVSYDYTYFSASVSIDGQRYEDIAVRKKGYLGSLSADRPSIKLDLGRNGRGLAHAGLEEITLNNDRQDPSHSHQCLAYGSFAAARLPASRCGLAHVVVNGEDLGTYSNVEPIGKPMLARHFADDGGNLYEGQIIDFVTEQLDQFQLKTNESAADRSDLTRLASALDGDDAGLVERLDAVLDLDAFRTFWALETLLGHWDGYAGNTNNFYVYHDPSRDRIVFLPWGTDGAFQWQNPFDFLNTSLAVYARGRIASRLYALPGERQAFRQRLAELADDVWVEERLNAELGKIERLAVDAPVEALATQRELIATHGGRLRAELALAAPEWLELPPAPPNACAGPPSEIRGTFSTTWGTLATPGAGTFTVEATIDGQPLEAAWTGGAGMDETLGDGVPRLRLGAQISAARSLGVDIQLTPRTFKVGTAPFHGIETVGFASVIDGTIGVLPGGFISDGAVELDAAGTSPGAAVSGRFSGRLLQFGCITE
jgi:hypothetical protein